MAPDLDYWLPDPTVCVRHRREADIRAQELWEAAKTIRLSDTRALGRLVRLRIPGIPAGSTYDEMFRAEPFNVLHATEHALLTGLVGRIWTLKRDFPTLESPERFRSWDQRGTVRVLFAIWVEPTGPSTSAMISETRVRANDRPAQIGLAAVRPLVKRSNNLVASEGLDGAIGRAQRPSDADSP